jgi:hypothetical protein
LDIGEFGLSVALTHSSTAFFHHIFHIVKLGAKKEMGRVAAFNIVAFMADTHLRWDRTKTEFIGKAMGPIALLTKLKLSVSPLRCVSIPLPTLGWIRGAINFVPKAFHTVAPKKMPLKAAIRTIAMQQDCALRGIYRKTMNLMATGIYLKDNSYVNRN